jgi:hypothetical protein
MRDGYQCKMKKVYIAREVSHRYSNGHRFDPWMPTHACVVLKTMHHAPVIQTVKQTIQLFRESTLRCDGRAAIDTCIADSSMRIKHIINPMQHWIKITRRLKIEGSMKPIRRTQCMKFDFNRGVPSVNVIDR